MASSLNSNSLNIGSTTLTDSSLNIGNTSVTSGSVTVGNSSLSESTLNLSGVALTPGAAGTIATTDQIPKRTFTSKTVSGTSQASNDNTDSITISIISSPKIISTCAMHGINYYWITNNSSKIVTFNTGTWAGFYFKSVQYRGHGIGDSTRYPIYYCSGNATSFFRTPPDWDPTDTPEVGSGIFFRID